MGVALCVDLPHILGSAARATAGAPTAWPPGSRSLKHTPVLFRTIVRFISRVLGHDDFRDPVAQIVSHMDFEIYWQSGPALSASEPLASPIHNDGGDHFGRFVDNDLASFKGQRDVENLEPSEAAERGRNLATQRPAPRLG